MFDVFLSQPGRDRYQLMTHSESTAWFALRVKSNREKVTSLSLMGKGYEVFLPEAVQYSNGTSATAKSPLFPGYLFCRFDVNRRLPILMLPGIVHIVSAGKRPLPVDEDELASLRIVIQAGMPVREENIAVGQPVRIERGPLRGAGGVVIGMRQQRLVVSISLLQRHVSVELDRDWISTHSVAAVAS